MVYQFGWQGAVVWQFMYGLAYMHYTRRMAARSLDVWAVDFGCIGFEVVAKRRAAQTTTATWLSNADNTCAGC